MAEAFLGLKVSVLLQSGIKLEGIVSHIEPTTQQMTLKDGKTTLYTIIVVSNTKSEKSLVKLFFFGQPPHHTPIYGVVGKDIKDLQVLSAAPNSQQQQQQTIDPNLIRSLDNHLLENLPPPTPQQQQQTQPQSHHQQQYSEKVIITT